MNTTIPNPTPSIEVKTRYTRGTPAPYSATELFSAQKRVLRGGSWQNPKIALLSALRQGAEINTWNTTVGFRCARSLRAGLDLVNRMLAEHRPWKALVLDPEGLLAYKDGNRDERLERIGHRTVAFIPSASPPPRQIVSRSRSQRFRFDLGLLVTTTPLRSPQLPAGSYKLVYYHQPAKRRADDSSSSPGWRSPCLVNDDLQLALLDSEDDRLQVSAAVPLNANQHPETPQLVASRCLERPLIRLDFQLPAPNFLHRPRPGSFSVWIDAPADREH